MTATYIRPLDHSARQDWYSVPGVAFPNWLHPTTSCNEMFKYGLGKKTHDLRKVSLTRCIRLFGSPSREFEPVGVEFTTTCVLNMQNPDSNGMMTFVVVSTEMIGDAT